ncbi:MAG: hypothetical protein M3M88_05785, partial [Thermoproteota archaeon]|nr:hypothetical protein [Thermoproteota archaeon]
MLLVSAPSTSSLTFASNHVYDSANKAFAQEGNDNIIRPQNIPIQFPSNSEQGQTIVPQQATILPQAQGQGQTILPQQATINPNNTQQTQEPIITAFTIPKNTQTENTGTANSGINGSTVDIPQNNNTGTANSGINGSTVD